MASRNKKGKVHGIFKSQFHISFFYKPSMEGTDIYYYIVLNDVIFMKMRLLYGIILIIDELYPYTSAYIEQEYDALYKLLESQTVLTACISLIGSTTAFRHICQKYESPIVEQELFTDTSMNFYNKYKGYCGNSLEFFGFYILALRDDTFKIMESYQENTIDSDDCDEDIPIIKPAKKPTQPSQEVDVKAEEPFVSQPVPVEEHKSIRPESFHLMDKLMHSLEHVFGEGTMSLNEKNMVYTITYTDGTECDFIIQLRTIQNIRIRCTNVSKKLNMVDALSNFSRAIGIDIYMVNIDPSDVFSQILEDKLIDNRFGIPPALHNQFVHQRLPIYHIK